MTYRVKLVAVRCQELSVIAPGSHVQICCKCVPLVQGASCWLRGKYVSWFCLVVSHLEQETFTTEEPQQRKLGWCWLKAATHKGIIFLIEKSLWDFLITDETFICESLPSHLVTNEANSICFVSVCTVTGLQLTLYSFFPPPSFSQRCSYVLFFPKMLANCCSCFILPKNKPVLVSSQS